MTTSQFEIRSGDESAEERRALFGQDGFIAVDLFSGDEVSRLREMVHSLVARPSAHHPRVGIFAASQEPVPGLDPANPYAVYKVVNTPLVDDAWFSLIMEPRVLGVVGELLGPDINFHMGFLRLRPPGLRVHEGWHRDFDTDKCTRPDLVTALIYLDEMSREAGATQVVPGSHRGALVEGTLDTRPITPPAPSEILHVTARPGTVLFLHCLTAHSIGTNQTPLNRSIILHEYKRADAVDVVENDAAFADLPLSRAHWTARAPV